MSKEDKFACKGCGYVLEVGDRVAIEIPPAPAVGLGSDPLGVGKTRTSAKPMYTITECTKCGKNEWFRQEA